MISKSITNAKSFFTASINNNRVLKLGYTGSKNAMVKLFTPAGRMVKSISLNGAKFVSLKGCNQGLYFVKFQAGGVSETKKFILK